MPLVLKCIRVRTEQLRERRLSTGAIRQDINDELVTYCDNLKKNNNDKNVNVCKFFHHVLTDHCELFNTDLTCFIK